MSRILFLLVPVLFILPVWQAHSAVESFSATRTASSGIEQKDPIAAIDCSSHDPAVVQGCVRELSMVANYLTANNSEAMNWLRRKSEQSPKALREAMAYCAEMTAPAGEMPSFPDLHRCARKRLGP